MKEPHDWSAFDLYLLTRHRCTRDDLEPTDVPGYWRHKAACGGKKGGCREPIHQTLFNDGPTQHTIQFLDKPERYKGRWRGRLTTWKLAHKENKAKARPHEQHEPYHPPRLRRLEWADLTPVQQAWLREKKNLQPD